MHQFYKQREDKRLYFTDTEQKIVTGLSKDEFEDMASYLEPYDGQYRRFDYKESLNILLMHIRISFYLF